MKERVVIIGAGLCGSVLACLLRNHFQVTIVERGRKKRPLFNDISCPSGEVNTSINRAEGLGGTTNYWHNALIELTDSDLIHAGINPEVFEEYYSKAWRFFLSDQEHRECDKIRDANRNGANQGGCTFAHMVVPYERANAWALANKRYPGDPIDIVYGSAEEVTPETAEHPGHVIVNTDAGPNRLEAEYFIVSAGGLASPVLLSRSIGESDGFCPGYHDHPMAYVGKIQLRPDSILKTISCKNTPAMDVRSGFIFEEAGMKCAFYLRPAVDMSLKSITGPARYILSDLRNAPFSLKKALQLFTNLDAVKEAVLFKTKTGFRGDCYSVLLLGEQNAIADRGVTVGSDKSPALNWHVTKDESAAYHASFQRFLEEFSSDIVSKNVIPDDTWEFRTAAHHSGASRKFVEPSADLGLASFAVKGMPRTYVCDGSFLRAGGIANSGLTLVALCHRLSELLVASTATSDASTYPEGLAALSNSR